MKIEKAIKKDAQDLTELTIRSKSYWNYSSKQIEAWREELSVSETYIVEKNIYKLTENNTIIGYYSYYELNKSEVMLENLFVEPQYIGKGIGKRLMSDFLNRLKNSDYKKALLDADPNAENFYAKLEFKVIGKRETSIKNRFMPIMEKLIQTHSI